MGAVFSCIASLCALIGDVIKIVVDAVFGVIMFIAQAIMSLVDVIVSIITLQWCRNGSRYGWGSGMSSRRHRFRSSRI